MKVNNLKNIAILTSGGDSPGMNAAIVGALKYAKNIKIGTYIVRNGYRGLVEGKIEKPNILDFESIISKGGTIIGSSRLPEFEKKEIRQIAINNLKKYDIDALIVIGGDGSFMGAKKLTEMGVNCVGIPGTIDNDINSSLYTIGFDTALNTVVESVDKIKDTIKSHNRCVIVEVMGKYSGFLSLYGGLASNADLVITPKTKLSEEKICEIAKNANKQGKNGFIIMTTELLYDVHKLSKKVEKISGYETRPTVIGYTQRGGNPTALDRIIGLSLGAKALEFLCKGHGGICLGYEFDKITYKDIIEASKLPPKSVEIIQDTFDKINTKG